MSIKGSLETFSLPELFYIIKSGNKSGKLIFSPNSKTSGMIGVYTLWFKHGKFITVTNSHIYQLLIAKIQDHGWIESKLVVKSKYYCPRGLPLGSYLKDEGLLSDSQLQLLFNTQLKIVHKLFDVESAQFSFQELALDNRLSSKGKQFPYEEMTGKKKNITQLSLEAMRNLSDWSRFAEEIPPSDMGLQRLTDLEHLQLNVLENNLWNLADGSNSLKKIAQKLGSSLEKVEQAALSMIFAGLIEEVPVIISAKDELVSPLVARQPALVGQISFPPTIRNKSKASSSFISNLVGFLKNNF